MRNDGISVRGVLQVVAALGMITVRVPLCFGAERESVRNITQPQASLVANGSFEEGEGSASGWLAEAGARLDGGARTGRYCATIARTSLEASPRWSSVALPCTEKAYLVSGWIATEMAAKADFSFAANLVAEFATAGGGTVTREVVGSSNGRTGWQYRAKRIVVPSQAATMRLVFEFSKDVGQAWLDDVCLTAAPSVPLAPTKIARAPGVLSLDLRTTAPAGNIFEPGEPVMMRATIRNATGEDREARLEYRVADLEGHTLAEGAIPARVAAKGEAKIEARLDQKRLPMQEYLELHAKMVDSSAEYDSAVTGLGILPRRKPTGPAEKSYFGLLGDGPGAGHFLAQRIGARWDRPGASWNDRHYDSARRYGIETVALIGDPQAVMNGTIPLEEFVSSVRKTVERYRGIVRYYQIGNEPDVFHEGMPQRYVTVLKAAYEAAKRADPRCKIVAAGITELQVKPAAWAELLKAGMAKYCDIYDHHIYYNMAQMDEILTMVNGENARHKAVKPQFMTETAASPPIGISETVKAAYVIKRYVLAIAQKIDVSFFHCLRWPAGGELDQVGLMHPRGYPWVSFFTFAAMTRELEGARFAKRLNWGEGLYAIQFDHQTHTDLVLWSDKGDRTLNLKTVEGPVGVTEISGRKTLGHTVSGQFTIVAGFYPLIIALPAGPVRTMATPPLLCFKGEECIVPMGGRAAVSLVARNPSRQPLTCRVTLSVPGTARVVSEPEAMRLNPGQSREVAFQLAAVPGAEESEGLLKALLLSGPTPCSFVVSKVRLSQPLEVKLIPQPSEGPPSIRVSVRNLMPALVSGRVRLTTELTREARPEEFEGEFPGLPSGKTDEVAFPLSTPADLQSMYNTEVRVEAQDGMTVCRREPLSFAPCYYADKPPTVDSDLSEWEGKLPLSIPYRGKWEWVAEGDTPPAGPKDLSARIGVMWDEKHFYLAAEVRDDVFRNENPDAMMWDGDGLQFTIDPDPEGSGSTGYYEFTLARTPKGNQFFAGTVPVGRMTGFWEPRMAIVRKEGVTCYELALDASRVEPLKLQADTVFGFALIVNEQDAGRRSFYGWYSGIGTTKARDQFGRLTMVGK